MAKILVVDDEASIVTMLAYNLKKEGYDVVTAEDGEVALEKFESEKPDLLLLDIMMPKMDGYGVCREIRRTSDVPIIILTALGDVSERITGLELGADDYVVKPFYMGELLARIRVAKRLSKKDGEEMKIYQKDYLYVDFISRKVLIDEQEIHLTPIEFNLLKLLIEHRGKVLTHNYIQKEIWGYQDHSNQNALRVFMATLRRKIEKDTNHPHFIVTEVGVGYCFND